MIRLQGVELRRGGRVLLQGADLQVHPGQRLGLTGANGAGKSSLFALIRGQLTPDAGEVSLAGPARIAHVAQETPALPMPALEFVLGGDETLLALEARMAQAEGTALAELHARYEAHDGYTARARAARLLAGLGFDTPAQQRPVADFSGGWRMRLNLARALMTPSDILLLDEPTNHLDLEAIVWLEGWLKGYSGALLLISHDRAFLDGVCTHIAHIERQQLTLYAGNYTDFETRRAEQLAQQQAMARRQSQERARLQAFIDRFRAKATKARQAQSRIRALERLPQIAAAHVDRPFRFRFPDSPEAGNPLIHLEEASVGHNQTPLLSGMDLRVGPGERIGLLGRNGAGKSTLIRLLAGQSPLMAGRQTRSPKLQIGYFAQHQLEQLDSHADPLTHLRRIDGDRSDEQTLRDFLGGFGFGGDFAERPVGPFSGGERARLALALIVWRAPNLLLLDEPTNHLDLDMREALELALQEYEGAMILVSHDRAMLEHVCDEYWRVHGGTVTRFDGNLDDYRQLLAREEARDAQAESSAQPAAADRRSERRQAAERRATLRPLKVRRDKLEAQLAEVALELEQIEAEMADPALYAGEQRGRLVELSRRQAALVEAQERIELEWLEVSDQLENG
ncbi:MAG: ABC-F family ATP-binding cassette domain-containing protein [Halothiobacillaceae bacterium]